MSKQTKKFKQITIKLFCGFLLVSFLLINLVIINAESSHQNSSYCPLQKSWVKQKPAVEVENNLLSNICASDETKEKIAFEISSKIFSTSKITEHIIFDYLEKGSFALLNVPQHSPKHNLANQTKLKIVCGNYYDNFITTSAVFVEFVQLARPPSFSHSSYFSPFTNKTFKQISHNINPRSPPIFS